MKKANFRIAFLVNVLFLVTFLFINCSDDESVTETEEEVTLNDPDFVVTDGTTETHSKEAYLNFHEVFDNTAVLYSDEVYKEIYDNYVQETINGPFETSYIQSLYDTYSALIEPYATTEVSGYTFLNSSSNFYQVITTLKSHASNRAATVANFLD